MTDKQEDISWQARIIYMLIIAFMLLANISFSQIKVVQYNAGWNKANDVSWVNKLKDCKTISYVDVAKNKKAFRLTLVLQCRQQKKKYKKR